MLGFKLETREFRTYWWGTREVRVLKFLGLTIAKWRTR